MGHKSSGPASKRRGNARNTRPSCPQRHRAHKRDSVVIPTPVGGWVRDARKAAKRAAVAAKIAELVADAEANLDAVQEAAQIEDLERDEAAC